MSRSEGRHFFPMHARPDASRISASHIAEYSCRITLSPSTLPTLSPQRATETGGQCEYMLQSDKSTCSPSALTDAFSLCHAPLQPLTDPVPTAPSSSRPSMSLHTCHQTWAKLRPH